ncbi:trifunctional hydroxymethylpyrimidine kinase/phosphomethylpyrimidine kinase/thiaminase [Thecaphora frezii]
MSPPPRVLAIAGSDSGGGAGVQADLKTLLSLGTYGLSVLTALTAQSTVGVSAIHAPPAQFVVDQLCAVLDDISIDAVKLGMLCNDDIVRALAKYLGQWLRDEGARGGAGVPLVLDPVMVSTSGSLLLSHDAVVHLVESLLPLCTVLTPNLPEAKQLLAHVGPSSRAAPASPGDDPADTHRDADTLERHADTDIPAMMEAARRLASLGPRAVLVKGGHAKLDRSRALQQIRHLTQGQEALVIPPQGAPIPPSSRVGFPERPLRRAARTDAASEQWEQPEPQEQRRRDLAFLAGKHGASITRCANVTVVRTDECPFADILRSAPAAAAAPPHRSPSQPDDSRDDADEVDRVICDVLYEEDADCYTLFVKPYVASTATHGTGCTLSSAMAASLAQGHSLLRSTSIAISYVQQALSCGLPDLGAGPGPLDHRFAIQPRGLLPASSTQIYPLCQHLVSHSLPLWTSFTRHRFVLALADRSLTEDAFVYFLKQDYLFLRHYARLWALAATFPSNSFRQISNLTKLATAMADEAEMHVELCSGFGVGRDELEVGTIESAATLAYTRYVEGVGRGGQALDLLVALAPCMLGYAEVGRFLGSSLVADGDAEGAAETGPSGGMQTWMRAYAADAFQEVVRTGMELIETMANHDPPSAVRLAALQKIWNAYVPLSLVHIPFIVCAWSQAGSKTDGVGSVVALACPYFWQQGLPVGSGHVGRSRIARDQESGVGAVGRGRRVHSKGVRGPRLGLRWRLRGRRDVSRIARGFRQLSEVRHDFGGGAGAPLG